MSLILSSSNFQLIVSVADQRLSATRLAFYFTIESLVVTAERTWSLTDATKVGQASCSSVCQTSSSWVSCRYAQSYDGSKERVRMVP